MPPETAARPPYRLVALDLDGTLMGRDLTFSPRSVKAVQAVMKAGAIVTLATGRVFRSTLPFAQELGVTAPLICYQGALIQHPISEEVLFHQPIPLEKAKEAIRMVQGWGLQVNAWVDDEVYVETFTPEAEQYRQIVRLPVNVVDDLISVLTAPPTKLVVVSQEGATDGVVRDLRAVFGDSLYITRSLPMYCEIAHPDCNKGSALALLAAHLGVLQEETVAIGDGLNDLEMLQWAGLGIAMGDAAPELKAAARWVTGPLGEDGAAAALERLFALAGAPQPWPAPSSPAR